MEFLQAIPLFPSEVAFKEAKDAEALMSRWESSRVPFWDPARSPEPVTAVAGPELRRLGQSVLYLPVAGVDEVAAAVGSATAGLGVAGEERPFRGHLTIARAARGVDPRPPVPVPFLASWAVDEVTLVASTLHPDGARYQVIGRYPLAGSS